MSDLEFEYRLLMRAYPSDHRARCGDEILSTLLDVADDDQRHPRLREAVAIVNAGLGCRIRRSTELQPGLLIAGVVALAATFSITAMAMVVAADRPLEIGLVPMLAWSAVAAAALLASWAGRPDRIIPAAVITVVMLFAGSSVMGLRRATIVPLAVLLLLSALSRPARRSVRLAATATGLAVGSLLGSRVISGVDLAFDAADSPWVYDAQWDLASDLVLINAPLLVAICLGVVVAATVLRRRRWALAAAVLAVPLLPDMLFRRNGPLTNILGPNDMALAASATAAVALAAAVGLSLSRRHNV